MALCAEAPRLARLFIHELRAGDGDAVRKHDVAVHSVVQRKGKDWCAFCTCIATGDTVYLDARGLRVGGGVHVGPMFLPSATDISTAPAVGEVFYGLLTPPTVKGQRATITDAVPAGALDALTNLLLIPANAYNGPSEMARFRACGAHDDTVFVCSRAMRGDFTWSSNAVLTLPLPDWQVMIALAVFLGDAQLYTRYRANACTTGVVPAVAPRLLPVHVVSAMICRMRRANALVRARG